MGTSKGSTGPGSGVALVPGWVADAETEGDSISPSGQENHEGKVSEAAKNETVEIASPARFRQTRRDLGQFGESGRSGGKLASGLGHYSRTGLGGSAKGSRRMGKTSVTAGALYRAVDSLRNGDTISGESKLTVAQLRGKSVREAGDFIIEAICPSDGTQDADSSRESINSAVADLDEQFESVELTALNDMQLEFLIERFIGYDISQRIMLDVGSSILKKASNASQGVKRQDELKSFVHEKVRISFERHRNRGETISKGIVSKTVSSIIKGTLEIFEEYLK